MKRHFYIITSVIVGPDHKSGPHVAIPPGKKGRCLRYNDRAIRLALRRAREGTPEFRDKYRFRAGIEWTMSQLDPMTGLKHLRVRGPAAVSFTTYLKAAGVNILRAAAFMSRKNELDTAPFAAVSGALLRCQRSITICFDRHEATNPPPMVEYALCGH